jgi:hypothetical protein
MVNPGAVFADLRQGQRKPDRLDGASEGTSRVLRYQPDGIQDFGV